MIKLLSLVPFLILSACAVQGDYTCGVPANGVRCQPMTATHAQLSNGTLSSLHNESFSEDESDIIEHETYAPDEETRSGIHRQNPHQTTTVISAPAQAIRTIKSTQAILSQPRHMRIWFDRFTDADGDLHDESFVHVRIDDGHWIIDDKPVLY